MLRSLGRRFNLDSWAMPATLLDRWRPSRRAADLFVIEGVMGLFDGAAGRRRPARRDRRSRRAFRPAGGARHRRRAAAQSAAAVVRGFASHDPAVQIAGVVLNRVGSERHVRLVAEAIAAFGHSRARRHPARCCAGAAGAPSRPGAGERACAILPRGSIASPTWPNAISISTRILDAASPLTARRLGTSTDRRCRRRASASRSRRTTPSASSIRMCSTAGAGRRRDRAVLAARRRGAAGALRHAAGCPAVSGASRRHARRCANASAQAWRRFAATRPVHGECGGYMVLGGRYRRCRRRQPPMTGLLGHATSFAQRKLHLGYRQARLLSDSPLGQPGTHVRGQNSTMPRLTVARR